MNIALFRQILNIEADITVRFSDFVSSAGACHLNGNPLYNRRSLADVEKMRGTAYSWSASCKEVVFS